MICSLSAEREGFEPPDLLQSTVFKTAAFDHSAISLCFPLLVVWDCKSRTITQLCQAFSQKKSKK